MLFDVMEPILYLLDFCKSPSSTPVTANKERGLCYFFFSEWVMTMTTTSKTTMHQDDF